MKRNSIKIQKDPDTQEYYFDVEDIKDLLTSQIKALIHLHNKTEYENQLNMFFDSIDAKKERK